MRPQRPPRAAATHLDNVVGVVVVGLKASFKTSNAIDGNDCAMNKIIRIMMGPTRLRAFSMPFNPKKTVMVARIDITMAPTPFGAPHCSMVVDFAPPHITIRHI